MADVPPIDSVTGPPQSSDSDEQKLQLAFQQGILNVMLSFVQGAESDVTDAINDTTSDPDDAGN